MPFSRKFIATCLALAATPTCMPVHAQPGPALAGTAISPAYQVKAPAGAPNVVIVLLDDVGFGAASTFGGPVQTPVLESLAREGLRYNNFHTTAICSPTRSALLTGRNAHATGIGAVANVADERPGYSSFHTKDTATIAEVLRQNGYNTAAFGKWHQTPDWELSPSGPFDRWPTGEGFERFYGFHGGETDQYEPSLYDGTTPVMRPPGRDYHLTADLADKAIDWLRVQHAVTPDKPVFLYFAPGAAHAPLQAPKAWIEAYRGKFDQGWDRLREEIFARQKALGVIPANTQLTARMPDLPAWDTLTPDQKRVASRLMEVYAGFLAHADAQVGRLVEALKANGQFDNTMFFYIVGDNGASAEGGLLGSASYFAPVQGLPESDATRLAQLDALGGPGTYPHYPAGWAWALDTPFKWTKAVASHLGGTRNPMVVTWPRHVAPRGGLRSQFGHVNDIVPTILEAARLPAPAVVNGIAQKPMDGVSLLYSFADASAATRHTTQYFEVFGHRALYQDGWMASAFHSRRPWTVIDYGQKKFEDDQWELYDLNSDFSQARDLAQREPERLARMQALFQSEAQRNQVLPLRNMSPNQAGALPSLSAGRTSMTFAQGVVGVPESALPKTYNRSWSVSATVDAGERARGVIATLGGHSAGWSLYLDDAGVPVFSYRLFNLKTVTLRGPAPLTAGRHQLRFDFRYDGGGYARGADVQLLVDGKPAGTDRLPASPPGFYTIDETFDVGIDHGSAAGDYPADALPGYAFSGGRIEQVSLDLR
ncbi:putative arylsulfatase precursor [Cupriavidus phytorum]|uniref:Arylsulfatase n=1 Tax=Cupriavidus taiwanensis TaxID=164546 RepID=A0A375CL82_9BURK|nr:arylsulfatase [Cupriavidus taiwanensis]SOY75135.1 putative arylsulfatase precursor [Cupriavidus taiwanensis]